MTKLGSTTLRSRTESISIPKRHELQVKVTTVPDVMDPDTENVDMAELLQSLSDESRTLVKIMKAMLTKKIKEDFMGDLVILRENLVKKDIEITNLKTEVRYLKIK